MNKIYSPANTGASDLDNNFAGLESIALLNLLYGRCCFRNVEIVLGISVHTDIRLKARLDGLSSSLCCGDHI